MAVGANLQSEDCGFVGLNLLLLLVLDADLHRPNLFGGVGEYKDVSHRANGAKAPRVGTGLDDV